MELSKKPSITPNDAVLGFAHCFTDLLILTFSGLHFVMVGTSLQKKSCTFVQDKDNRLHINNTEFAIDMADEHWHDIDAVF